MLFLVMLQVDNGGSALIVCREIAQDPLLPNNAILLDVVALDWPVSGKFMDVKNWSVMKSSILNYMMGELKDVPTMTVDMLSGEEKKIPYPPGALPSQPLVTPERAGELTDSPEG